jgi:hypothetical protein
MKTVTEDVVKKPNRDLISGEPGAHPVGVGVGAAVGTTAGAAAGAGATVAAGAAAGSVVGPVGTALGAVVGGVAAGIGGGLVGKAIAEQIDPTAEEVFWEENFHTQSYAENATFDEFRTAFRYGVDSYLRYPGSSFDSVEPELARGWHDARGSTKLEWPVARLAAKAAYERAMDRSGRGLPHVPSMN